MRIFAHKGFVRFARKVGLIDRQLAKAVEDAEAGLIDADYGAGVIKMRIARQGQGKSGGYRSIIFFKLGDRAIFAHGFAKKDKANITRSEEQDLKSLAGYYLRLNEAELKQLLAKGVLKEIEP